MHHTPQLIVRKSSTIKGKGEVPDKFYDEQFFETASEEILQDFYSSANPETLQYINLKINPKSFLDVLLMEIRRETISFSSRKKRDRQASEQLLLHSIESLETQLAAEQTEINFQNINTDLQAKKIELENIYAIQAQGAFIRARARYKIQGEKPSRLFCSLEKHNAIQKHIPKLIVDCNGQKQEITDQKGVAKETYV